MPTMPRSSKPILEFDGPETAVLNEAAIAEILGCTERQVAKLFLENQIRGRRSGAGGWRTTRRMLLKYLEEVTDNASRITDGKRDKAQKPPASK